MPLALGLVAVAVLLATAPSRAQDAGTEPPKHPTAGEPAETRSPPDGQRQGTTEGVPAKNKKAKKKDSKHQKKDAAPPDAAVDPCRFHPDAPGCRK
ncbi:MAG TPA: hypothetical protein VI356_03890 [Myxococcales bacterium]